MHTTSTDQPLGLREPREKADITMIRTAVTDAVRDAAWHWDRLQRAYNVLMCDREGRDGTGRTGVDEQNRLRGPFLGSSDTDVALAAEVLKEKTDMLRLAVSRGSMNVKPVDGMADAQSAAVAGMEMLYYLNGPMRWNVLTTLAQAAKWHRGFCSFIVGIDWRRRTHGRERLMTLAEVFQWAVEQGTQDFMESLAGALASAGGEMALEEIAPETAEQLVGAAQQAGMEQGAELVSLVRTRDGRAELAQVLEFYATATGAPLCEGEAVRAARAFQMGETEVEVCCYEVVEDCPEWRPLRPGVDILFPPETTRIAEAEWTVEPLWMTARQVRERAAKEGWEQSFTDELLQNPGMPFGLNEEYGQRFPWLLTTTSVGHTIPYDYREKEFFCPVLFTYRAASKAGVGAIYQCLVHDKIETFGYHKMVDSLRGLMPYEDFRSDLTEKVLLECRGLVEEVESYQEQLKGNLDALFDRISMETNPPLVKPSRLEGTDVRHLVGPGSELSLSRTDQPGSWQFLQLGQNGGGMVGKEMDAMLRKLVCRRFALRHPELDPSLAQACWQVETDDFLNCTAILLKRTYEMIQQYGPEWVRVRVTETPGVFAATGAASRTGLPDTIARAEVRGSFDFDLDFDTTNLVQEWQEARGKQFAALLSIDNMSAVPRVPILRAFASMISPKLAAVIMDPGEAAQQQIERTQADIAAIVSGQEPPFVPGQNHALALQIAQETYQKSPLFRQYLTNPQVQAVFENWAKQHQHQVDQEENKIIGHRGGRPVLTQGNGR